MERIFLVSPPLEVKVQEHIKNNSYGLGLGYLHAVIEKAGYSIMTECYNNHDNVYAEKVFVEEFNRLDPDCLLVQMFTMNRVSCYRIIQIAREIKPGVKIVVGGVHATIMFEQLLQNFDIDCIVIGEGELTIVELLNSFKEGHDIANVKGIAFKKGGKVVITPERELLVDLDSLPFPKHELFITADRDMACILTSRGCPFKCTFCCLHSISKRKYRVRSVDNIVSEIEYIRKTFKNIRHIQIPDDTFTLNQQRAIDFCNEIIGRNIKMKFSCVARIKPASKELFDLMEKAGFESIGFGLETGSEKLLKDIHKNITPEDVLRTFEMLRDSKINVTTFLIVGFPGETSETVNETISLVKRLQKIKYYEFKGVAKLWVYPNTEVFQMMKKAGMIDEDYWLTEQDVPHYTVEHNEKELDKMVVKISLSCMTKRQMLRRTTEMLTDPRLLKTKVSKLIKIMMRAKQPEVSIEGR